MRDYGGMPHGDDHSVHAPSGADSHSSPSASYAKVPLLSIFIYTTIMALASGFGAVPFFIFGRLKPYWAGIANAVAVGVMLAASFDLLQEGAPHSPALTILGMVIGALFIKASQDYLSQVGQGRAGWGNASTDSGFCCTILCTIAVKLLGLGGLHKFCQHTAPAAAAAAGVVCAVLPHSHALDPGPDPALRASLRTCRLKTCREQTHARRCSSSPSWQRTLSGRAQESGCHTADRGAGHR